MLSSEHDALVLLYDEAENIFIELARPGLVEHASRHITGGDDEIDGDKLDIDWNPSNYTPTTSPSEADNVDNLTAHLAGIDAALDLNPLTVLDGSTVAINDGILTPTGSYHTVEAEIGTADDLDYVMDGEEGNLLFLRPVSGHTITVRDNEGDLRLHDGNFVMSGEDEFILLCWVDELGEWVEVARSTRPLTVGGVFNFTGTMGNSSKDPTADAPADWVEVEIGGLRITCRRIRLADSWQSSVRSPKSRGSTVQTLDLPLVFLHPFALHPVILSSCHLLGGYSSSSASHWRTVSALGDLISSKMAMACW